MKTLILLSLLPLIAIPLLGTLDVSGYLGYSLYKVFFIVPPCAYCFVHGISLRDSILKLSKWRQGFLASLGLGMIAFLVFWSVYWLLGDTLLDEARIVSSIEAQFGVTERTVLAVAPITIFLNSFLEEFFYRGFSFGRLVRLNPRVGYLVPAAVYALAHVVFFQHWLGAVAIAIATGGLFVFALVLQRLYAHADTLVAPWIVHVFGDAAMMSIALAMLWRS
jgi:membrane protease YdiL (CAAX protease family)